MHFVIIGNGVAGINAANTVRNRETDAEITIVSYEHDHFFSRTALMYVFCGQLSERCVEPYERDHYKKMGFNRLRERVTRLDAGQKRLHFESGSSVNFDRLLIASGSEAVMAPWPGRELDGVGHFVSWQQLHWLQKQAASARRAVVVGGGLIGIEVAEILLMAGITTTFLVREPWFWPVALNKDEGDLVTAHMRHHGCDVRLNTEMKQIIGENGRAVAVETTEGERIDCDIVVTTIGVRPQTEFLKDSGLEFGERGGIVIDDRLRTNLHDIWAAGDCTEVVWFNGVRRPEQLWYTSRDQGLAAARNMLGDDLPYVRGTFYNSAKFFDIEYTTAGYVNFNFDSEQNWYQHEPDTNNTIRLTYLPDQTVIGFNGLGRRWDHRVFVQWIEQKRGLPWVLDHLPDALFDEEFMPKFKLTSLRP